MSEGRAQSDPDDILPEYDFSRARRNPYASRHQPIVTAVVLEADVAASFPDSKSVNGALRQLAKGAARPKTRKRRRRSV